MTTNNSANKIVVASLQTVASNEELLEIGRQAVEKTLLEWRDSRLSEPFRGNGLVCREKNGEASDIIRFGPETCLAIGLKAIAEHLKKDGT